MSIPVAPNLQRALGLAGALAALAGCGEGAPQPPAAVSLAPIQSQISTAAKSPTGLAVRAERAATPSWMDSRAAKGALLYISDSSLNDVFAFTWPKLRLVGNLSGLHFPQGLCVDAGANVYVTDTARSQVLEYPHGSAKSIKRLADPHEYPASCWVAPNGDLAVGNILSRQGHSYGAGSLSIYKGAAGRPKTFAYPGILKLFFDAYDAAGNVLIDGQDPSGNFAIAEFNGKKFIPLTVSGATINAPGSVQVTGPYVNVEDQLGASGNSVIYRTTLNGTVLTVNATAQLFNGMDCVGSYIYGKAGRRVAICPDQGSAPSINVYKYPAGGPPIVAFYRTVLGPSTAVVSP
ncbi:MAG: hypothetical protein JO078_01605 [Candidatus Eremiobacteraeota bacterium]|nr:hypothetical protein [Candidatus Eremiobacteraeota bacterium]MBV9056887.1 hypothetical protein [Candidatus Eremiobacteraeota bacterium]MBV9698798.1 hypothetical protein [Candidatus Eremiobacteraeota bacterium]